MFYPDGGNPPDHILKRFIEVRVAAQCALLYVPTTLHHPHPCVSVCVCVCVCVCVRTTSWLRTSPVPSVSIAKLVRCVLCRCAAGGSRSIPAPLTCDVTLCSLPRSGSNGHVHWRLRHEALQVYVSRSDRVVPYLPPRVYHRAAAALPRRACSHHTHCLAAWVARFTLALATKRLCVCVCVWLCGCVCQRAGHARTHLEVRTSRAAGTGHAYSPTTATSGAGTANQRRCRCPPTSQATPCGASGRDIVATTSRGWRKHPSAQRRRQPGGERRRGCRGWCWQWWWCDQHRGDRWQWRDTCLTMQLQQAWCAHMEQAVTSRSNCCWCCRVTSCYNRAVHVHHHSTTTLPRIAPLR